MNNLQICPICADKGLDYLEGRKWKCRACGFTLYNNVASAVGLIIAAKNKASETGVLCIKRGRDPRKGFYAFPGGFIDPDESAESACMRECREETGIIPLFVRYVCSAPNTYDYKNIRYKSCDLFFEAGVKKSQEELSSLLRADDEAEIGGFKFFPVKTEADIEAIPFAFPSAVFALKIWLKSTKPKTSESAK